MSSFVAAGPETVAPRTWRKVGIRIIPLVGLAYVASHITGYISSWTGNFTYALLTIAIIMSAGLVFLLTAGRRMERLDRSLS
ncbi:hypothetical protein [Embleya sp. MST-111070]|uniref:hypothetical protein n=1 Tax=Embleya sp. MST-111070 TaxID=3398231 RepID=UPI003F7329E2